MKLRVVVADDELQARKRVARLLAMLPDVEVVATCANAEEVLAQLQALRADVLLLDISMPGLGGLGLSRTLGDRGPAVIFVTAHAEHALEAFELGAVDYVMKPVSGARLAKAIARARDAQPTSTPQARVPIDTRSGVVLVDPNAIIYARFDGALVTIVTPHESWLTTTTLKELEGRLPAKFERVDRRHLLNLDEVVRLEPEDHGGYQAITRTGVRVPVSRQIGRELRRRFGL